MAQTTTRAIRRWAAWTALFVLVISLGIWFLGRDTLPRTIRIATGKSGGLYYRFGTAVERSLADRTHRRVDIVATEGSVENRDLLASGEVDLAVIQGGAVGLNDLSVVTPLFSELVFVIVRKDRGIERIADLAGKNVSLDLKRSGSRESARQVLSHFGVDMGGPNHPDRYFTDLLTDPELDAAIVTAGIGHPDLTEVLRSGEFKLLPITVAEAVEVLHPFLVSTAVPQGLFTTDPSVPADKIPTIATTAYLVTRKDASDGLVAAALASVHEESLRLDIPTLIPRGEAPSRVPTRFHPVAQRYFNPSDNIGYMANVMESLAATKELVFALGAGLYLLWLRWRGLKKKEDQEALSRHKEQLDLLLGETLRIEQRQMRTTDTAELRELLDNVTRIKLKALHEFTEEELRGDQAFTIFLMQCANLISKIQMKIFTSDSALDQRQDSTEA